MNKVDKEIEENFYNCGGSLWVLQYRGQIHCGEKRKAHREVIKSVITQP